MLKFKNKFLTYNAVNFNAVIKLPEHIINEISWWENNIFEVFKSTRYPQISVIIYTDAHLGHGFQMRSWRILMSLN